MPTIKIYTTPFCIWCARTKQYLRERNIPYDEIDVASNQKAAEEMVNLSGQYGVPVIVIGKEMIIGFDPNAIEQAYRADM